MLIAYIAGPYRDKRGPYYIGQNIRKAQDIAAELAKMGIGFFCPHMNSAFMDGLADDEYWLSCGQELLRRCDFVVVAPDYGSSQGTMGELELAKQLNLPIFFWPQDKSFLAKFHNEKANAQTK